MLAAMYLRKSRAEENEPVSDTLSRHRDMLVDYAKKEKITVTGIYEEVASGDSLYKRPEMLRLLDDLQEYDAVLCMDIDRLGRGAMHEQGLIFEAFRTAGTLIVTPSKTYDLRDDMDDSLISFKALFAREEYKMIRGRLRRGVLKSIEEGCYVSNAPFGYKQIRIKKKPTLEIVPEEADGVRMIFKLYCEGYGCQAVADTVHALGYRPRRGQKFNRTSIAKILRNPTYIGKIVWNQRKHIKPTKPGEKHRAIYKPASEWQIFDGLHKPIVDRELFDEANRRLQGRYHPPSNNGLVMNSLSGILFCSLCGKTMVRQLCRNKKKMVTVMLVCPTVGCMMGNSLEAVEEMLYDSLKAELNAIKADIDIDAKLPALKMEDAARVELSRLKQQSAKLHDLLEQGVYDIDTFRSRRDELRERIEKTRRLLEVKPAPKQEFQLRLTNVMDKYWEASPEERNRMLKAVLKQAAYSKPKGSGWGASPVLEIMEWRD